MPHVTVPAVLGTASVAATQTACSSTCSDSEEKSCTEKYTSCISAAVAAADLNACTTCNNQYCDCYDACGTSCDKGSLRSCQ